MAKTKKIDGKIHYWDSKKGKWVKSGAIRTSLRRYRNVLKGVATSKYSPLGIATKPARKLIGNPTKRAKKKIEQGKKGIEYLDKSRKGFLKILKNTPPGLLYRAQRKVSKKIGEGGPALYKAYKNRTKGTLTKEELAKKNEALKKKPTKSESSKSSKPSKSTSKDSTAKKEWLKKTRNSPAAKSGVFTDDERWNLHKNQQAFKARRKKRKKKE
tara:strand:- start:276 stop:914 length:639 start_codon:yes stop_codon:yes gene_type:complete